MLELWFITKKWRDWCDTPAYTFRWFYIRWCLSNR
jgi:hypothetical protein